MWLAEFFFKQLDIMSSQDYLIFPLHCEKGTQQYYNVDSCKPRLLLSSYRFGSASICTTTNQQCRGGRVQSDAVRTYVMSCLFDGMIKTYSACMRRSVLASYRRRADGADRPRWSTSRGGQNYLLPPRVQNKKRNRHHTLRTFLKITKNIPLKHSERKTSILLKRSERRTSILLKRSERKTHSRKRGQNKKNKPVGQNLFTNLKTKHNLYIYAYFNLVLVRPPPQSRPEL